MAIGAGPCLEYCPPLAVSVGPGPSAAPGGDASGTQAPSRLSLEASYWHSQIHQQPQLQPQPFAEQQQISNSGVSGQGTALRLS